MNSKLWKDLSYKNDSNKCFQAIQILNNKIQKQISVCYKNNEQANSTVEQIKMITEHFKEMLGLPAPNKDFINLLNLYFILIFFYQALLS